MSRISKWLESLNPEEINTSNTTSSVYYIIEGLHIRLADHFTAHPDNCDLQIIIPINNSSIYIVTIKEGLQILGFKTLPQLQEFIKTYSLINRISKTSNEIKNVKANLITEPEKDPIKERIVNAKNRTSNDLWGKVCEYLVKDCFKWQKLSVTQKQACKKLLATNRPYRECVRHINVITSSKGFTTLEMTKYFEPFINESLNKLHLGS